MTNATNEASSMSAKDSCISKLIDLSEKQNELIFATRKRLFQLEQTQNQDTKVLITCIGLVCVVCVLMCLEFGGFTW